MTLDKIKHYMNPKIYKHWIDLNNCNLRTENEKQTIINKAKKTLDTEIKKGILKDIKYTAELNLLNILSR